MHSILVPWRHREQLLFPSCSIYEAHEGLAGPKFSVPIAQRPGRSLVGVTRPTIAPDLLKGWAEAVETMPPAHWQASVGSKIRPWVRDMDRRFNGSLLPARLKDCQTANTTPDQVFEGADLCLWVEPIHLLDYDERDYSHNRAAYPRDMPRAWLALVGVDICTHAVGSGWTPIPSRLLPKH